MIKVELIGADKVVARFQKMWPALQAATIKSITGSLIELTRYVKANKLSGQVLKNRTGRLRRSVHSSGVRDIGGEVSGTVGTNVEYAQQHEYGFTGTVTIKAHMRTIKQAWGHSLKSPRSVSVRSHGRQVNLPERSFLRSALQELAPQFIARLQKDINEAIK